METQFIEPFLTGIQNRPRGQKLAGPQQT